MGLSVPKALAKRTSADSEPAHDTSDPGPPGYLADQPGVAEAVGEPDARRQLDRQLPALGPAAAITTFDPWFRP